MFCEPLSRAGSQTGEGGNAISRHIMLWSTQEPQMTNPAQRSDFPFIFSILRNSTAQPAAAGVAAVQTVLASCSAASVQLTRHSGRPRTRGISGICNLSSSLELEPSSLLLIDCHPGGSNSDIKFASVYIVSVGFDSLKEFYSANFSQFLAWEETTSGKTSLEFDRAEAVLGLKLPNSECKTWLKNKSLDINIPHFLLTLTSVNR